MTRLAVPGMLVTLLAAGAVTATAQPSTQTLGAQASVPTTAAAAAPAVRDDALERTTRLLANGRPAITSDTTAEAAAAAKAKAERKKEAQAKAKAKKAKAERAKARAEREAKAEKKAKAEKEAAAEKKAEARKKARQVFKPTAAQLEVTGTRYTRVPLNVRTQPSSSADLVTVLDARSKLKITDTTKGSWTLVIHRDKGRWVHSRYLTKSKPKAKAVRAKSNSDDSSSGGGISMARCASGSGMESGLTQDAIRVHRAVCNRYPSVKSFGGLRSGSGSFHGSGRAVDVMVSGSKGWDIARWVRANRKELGVSEIIYAQKIWTVQRGSEGWRSMSDRGNATANHYDHVHVSVYGNRGNG